MYVLDLVHFMSITLYKYEYKQGLTKEIGIRCSAIKHHDKIKMYYKDKLRLIFSYSKTNENNIGNISDVI